MKKYVIALLLIVSILFTFTYATADLDLSSMSFEDLIALRDKVMDEILTREEWDDVLIPAGVYEIGVDIPEGMWTITAESYSDPYVNIGNGINDTYDDFADGSIDWEHLYGELNKHHDSTTRTSVTWKFSKGHYFISDGPTVWTRAVRPAFDFYANKEE